MLHKNEIDLTQDELTLLANENAKLLKQSNLLHGQAITTVYKVEKDRIMAERAELETKIHHNQARIEELKEQEALKELINLLKRHIHDVRVSVNGSRQNVGEDLNVTVTFEGCNHSFVLPIFELLRIQSTIQRNRHLLAVWQTNLNGNYTTTRTLLCKQCLQDKKEKLEKKGIYQPTKRTGTARIEIIVFR